MHQHKIHEYIYNKKNQPVGVLLATTVEDSNTVYIGWSLCAANKGDRFDKSLALEIATQRSIKGSFRDIPNSIVKQYTAFGNRATKYFKDKKVTFVAKISEKSLAHSGNL